MHVIFLKTNTSYPIVSPHDCANVIINEYKKDTSIPLDEFIDNTIIIGLTITNTVKVYGTIYEEINDDETLRHLRDPEDGLLYDEIELKL